MKNDLPAEVSEELRRDIAAGARLVERDEALTDALTPIDWYERPPKRVELLCGCVSDLVQDTDGESQWYERKWLHECEEHTGEEDGHE